MTIRKAPVVEVYAKKLRDSELLQSLVRTDQMADQEQMEGFRGENSSSSGEGATTTAGTGVSAVAAAGVVALTADSSSEKKAVIPPPSPPSVPSKEHPVIFFTEAEYRGNLISVGNTDLFDVDAQKMTYTYKGGATVIRSMRGLSKFHVTIVDARGEPVWKNSVSPLKPMVEEPFMKDLPNEKNPDGADMFLEKGDVIRRVSVCSAEAPSIFQEKMHPKAYKYGRALTIFFTVAIILLTVVYALSSSIVPAYPRYRFFNYDQRSWKTDLGTFVVFLLEAGVVFGLAYYPCWYMFKTRVEEHVFQKHIFNRMKNGVAAQKREASNLKWTSVYASAIQFLMIHIMLQFSGRYALMFNPSDNEELITNGRKNVFQRFRDSRNKTDSQGGTVLSDFVKNRTGCDQAILEYIKKSADISPVYKGLYILIQLANTIWFTGIGVPVIIARMFWMTRGGENDMNDQVRQTLHDIRCWASGWAEILELGGAGVFTVLLTIFSGVVRDKAFLKDHEMCGKKEEGIMKFVYEMLAMGGAFGATVALLVPLRQSSGFWNTIADMLFYFFIGGLVGVVFHVLFQFSGMYTYIFALPPEEVEKEAELNSKPIVKPTVT